MTANLKTHWEVVDSRGQGVLPRANLQLLVATSIVFVFTGLLLSVHNPLPLPFQPPPPPPSPSLLPPTPQRYNIHVSCNMYAYVTSSNILSVLLGVSLPVSFCINVQKHDTKYNTHTLPVPPTCPQPPSSPLFCSSPSPRIGFWNSNEQDSSRPQHY